MSGDIVLAVTPATIGSSAAAIAAAIAGAASKFSRTVTVKLTNAAGVVHEWFNGTLHMHCAEVTAGDGTVSFADTNTDTTVTFVQGVASITLDYVGAWAADDTATITVGETAAAAADEVLGKALTKKTSVDTVVA